MYTFIRVVQRLFSNTTIFKTIPLSSEMAHFRDNKITSIHFKRISPPNQYSQICQTFTGDRIHLSKLYMESLCYFLYILGNNLGTLVHEQFT